MKPEIKQALWTIWAEASGVLDAKPEGVDPAVMTSLGDLKTELDALFKEGN